MTVSREVSPVQLFLRMMSNIALTGIGRILLILVLIVHVKVGGSEFAASAHDVLRVRMIALCTIVAGLPIWLFTQLRMARGIRDGEWSDSKLRLIRRIALARSLRPMGIVILLIYGIAISLRGRFYWLVGVSVFVFPLGASSDLHKQFAVRDLGEVLVDGSTTSDPQPDSGEEAEPTDTSHPI